MNLFRGILILMTICIFIITGIVSFNHGWNLLPIFFGDMFSLTWPGQFNFDFMCFLILSGLWVSWRNNFSFLGSILGIAAIFGGIMFLAPYLLIESFRSNGDFKLLLLGKSRV